MRAIVCYVRSIVYAKYGLCQVQSRVSFHVCGMELKRISGTFCTFSYDHKKYVYYEIDHERMYSK